MKYISFIDILGTKNSSENENFEGYLEQIVQFQYKLIFSSKQLVDNGRVHFFSDCAYIESDNIEALIVFLLDLRRELLEVDIFLRGSVVKGSLGAITGSETNTYFSQLYNNDKNVLAKYHSTLSLIKKNKKTINGTVFLSTDISKAYYYENSIKAASIYIEYGLLNEIGSYVVPSGYLKSISPLEFENFYDLKYEEEFISESFLDHILFQYTSSNLSDVTYGRYYLSILLSCISSSTFNDIRYDSMHNDFVDTNPIFDCILNLRKRFTPLYNNAKGLEYVYFSLINKIYLDKGECDETTKQVINVLFRNKRFMSKYENKMSRVPKEVISKKVNYCCQEIITNFLEKGYKKNGIDFYPVKAYHFETKSSASTDVMHN